MINIDPRSSAEVLMESLALVEGADKVVIVLQKDDCINVKTNCDFRDLNWLLVQANHAALNDMFYVKRGDDD